MLLVAWLSVQTQILQEERETRVGGWEGRVTNEKHRVRDSKLQLALGPSSNGNTRPKANVIGYSVPFSLSSHINSIISYKVAIDSGATDHIVSSLDLLNNIERFYILPLVSLREKGTNRLYWFK